MPNFYIAPVAPAVPFDNATNGFTADNVQAAIEEAKAAANPPKAGSVPVVSFTGNPKKATVTFTTAMADTNYEIAISGTDARFYSWESKTVNGFVINLNANQAPTAAVNWAAFRDSNP
jgi:hypothetical protein